MVAFDPAAKERELHDEANSWDTSAPVPAEPGGIPTVDVGPWVESGDPADLAAAAEVLQDASERVGFHQLVGHGISDAKIDEIFAATRAFHALDDELKQPILMDRPGHPIGGSGWMPVGERKLLRTWSNDRVLSTRHFANNSATESRYSIPFFFNATGDFPMECLPTCHGPDNPPKYPTISYNQSQAVVQGE